MIDESIILKEAESRYEQYPNAEVSYHNTAYEEEQDAFCEGAKWHDSLTVNDNTKLDDITHNQLMQLRSISLENIKMIDDKLKSIHESVKTSTKD